MQQPEALPNRLPLLVEDREGYRNLCRLLTCIKMRAPKGEGAAARRQRIRQYEDFFNATGMATPDDLEEFRACQQGYAGISLAWNDMCRGATQWVTGPDAAAQEIGLNPALSGVKTEDEGLYTVQHRYWMDVMKTAIAKEQDACK